MDKGDGKGSLHGGENGAGADWHEGDHWYKYRNDALRNGRCVTSSQLTDANEGDGGLAFIPGIHKSNFVGNLPADVRNYERQRRNLLPPSIGKRPRVDEVNA